SNDAWLSSNSSSPTGYISPPTRPGYTFTGYFTSASGGTQYVASNGALMNSAGYLGSQTLYARWEQNVYTLTFNNQGVANTSTTIAYNENIPTTAAVPTRTGYKFNGYYSAASGGTQHYNSDGTLKTTLTMSDNQTLYAQWTANTYTITYGGLEGATLTSQPVTHTFNAATVIPSPTKTDYTFMGWYVNGGKTLNRDLTLSPTGYTGNIALTANWKKKTDATVDNTDKILTSDNISKEDLQKIFDAPVEDATKGVTAAELNNSASVNLTLKVTGITGTATGEDAIKKETNGEVVKFFDVKVVKEVTAPGGQVTTTTLTEVPSTITIRIPLTGDMADKSSYQVLRYHSYTENKDGQTNTINETHKLLDGANSGEYCAVEKAATGTGSEMVIKTRLFSTYAIAAGQTSLAGNGTLGEGTNTDGSGVDVQARMAQNGTIPVYKIDVAWGPMVFEYTTSREWDPNNHVYLGASYDWAKKSFENGNNRVSLANHSNADVNVDFAFAREKGQLDGVDVSFREINSETAPAVSHYYLQKVPQESADAPLIQSFLWLRGTPKVLPGTIPPVGGESALAKVGVIQVTIAAQQKPILTPKA
ncbi:MAG: InlB B-repeat-containing protein, partial [Oscillospiraceae bacterium]